MRRRTFLSTLAAVSLPAVIPPFADAQQRAELSPTGPLEGREPAQPSQLTPEERRHVPRLMLPRQVRQGRPFDLVLQVGIEPHGMARAHHIDWVEVALDEERVFIADLSPQVGYPIVRVPLVLERPAQLTARAHCNLHGVWRTRRQLDVR